MAHQSDMDTCPMADSHCHSNSQDQISEKLCRKKDVGPTCGFTASHKVVRGPLSVPCRPSTPVYMLQAKTMGRACAHALPRATTALEPASLLREGSGIVTCPKAPDPAPPPRRAPALPRVLRLQTPPRHPGGLRQCHTSLGTGPRLVA
jgi:hypothetical protein